MYSWSVDGGKKRLYYCRYYLGEGISANGFRRGVR